MTTGAVMCLTGSGTWRTTAALVRAAHSVPTAAVTAFTAVLAAAMGTGWGRTGLLAAAVLAGQLSVGWLNDLLDRHRDRAAGRADKPVALGLVSPRTVAVTVGAAATACVPLSLSLGLAAGSAHLAAVAGAWAYNLGLKRTPWSWVPYALGFGLLPVVVWLAAPPSGLPPAWMIGAAALLGVSAHAANVLPDLDADRSAGVLGLPHRMPASTLRLSTVALLLSAMLLLTFGPAGTPSVWELGTLGLVAVLAVPAAGAPRRLLPPRAPFLAVVGIAVLAVGMLLIRGTAG